LLTSEPEMPDCPFLPEVLYKVSHAKAIPALAGVEWVVDGGVNVENIGVCAKAGVDTIVIGRALFANGEVGKNLSRMKTAII